MLTELANAIDRHREGIDSADLRVLALTTHYPTPWQPQRATYNRRHFRSLSERCPVRIISPITWSDEIRARRAGKARLPTNRQVELDGLKVDHPRVLHVPGMLRNMYGRFYYWSVRNTFRQVCREFKPTIVYAPWIYPDGWAAIKLAREAGLPVVLKALGSDVLLLDENPGRRAGTIEALRSADGIIAVSQDLTNKMIALGANPDRVRVVYCGVERHLFHPGSKSEARSAVGIEGTAAQLLFVGNLVPVKGIDVLLKACARLKSRGIDFQLHIVGEGPLKQELKKLSETLGIAARVRWHGSIPQTQLPNWYQAADVLVLASRSEGVPNVLLEASGCHTPWVATRVGGIPEIAHLGTNRIVSPESAEDLGEGIAALLTSPSGRAATPRAPEGAAIETADFLSDVRKQVESTRKSQTRCSI